MCISIANYQYFQYTRDTVHGIERLSNRPASRCLDLVEKVATIAFAAFSLIGALFLDLAYSAAALIYKGFTYCYRREPEKRVLSNPYPVLPRGFSNQKFLEDSLRSAFRFLPPEKVRLYKQMIRNEGWPDKGEPPVDIFQWAASCLIVQYLVARAHTLAIEEYYPGSHRGDEIRDLYQNFAILEDQGKTLLQIIDSEKEQPLMQPCKNLVQQVRALATRINQDQFFLTEIYGPVAKRIDNI